LTPSAVERFGAHELGQFLSTPYAAERLSPIEGPGVVVLDLAATNPGDADLWRGALVDQLPVLPCVTVGIETAPAGQSERLDRSDSKRILTQACDVILSETEDLPAFLAGFSNTPIAALAFVQLLRSSPARSINAGLIAESFVYSTLQGGPEFARWLARRRHRVRSTRTRAIDDGPACRFERDRDRLTLTLCRPAKHNAFSRELRDALVEGLQFALADASIDEVVLCGEGESFCSGGDLDEFGSAPNPAEAHVVRTTRSPAWLISTLAGRIRSEVHGACLGAGVELPAFTDRIVAREDAFFQLPEIAMGLIPGAGGTVSLPARIGRQRTAWLGLSGGRIDSQTALEWGLVDEVRLGQHVEREAATKSDGSVT
jgi:enoyl-CoA hydratase